MELVKKIEANLIAKFDEIKDSFTVSLMKQINESRQLQEELRTRLETSQASQM
jgi:hypothetical protein